jgi:hypothetical protein
MANDVTASLTRDHMALTDAFAARRYFAKFEAIMGHLTRVAALLKSEGRFSAPEVEAVTRYLVALNLTFRALSMKYLLTGRETGAPLPPMQIDRVDSGFPVFNELLVMANDAMQASRHLDGLPPAQELKEAMLRRIVGEQTIPTKEQFALSQRLYYEELLRGRLFWARNDPQAVWLSGDTSTRRRYLIHWASYDSQVNLPAIYLMEVEDSARVALPKDPQRWPEVQAHLMGQSMGGLKLLTIAKGFDDYFNDLHPKRLRRLHVGPMYSSAYTEQQGPIREVLASAAAPLGQDWALTFTLEDLESDSVREEKLGWFSSVERQVFALDPFSGRGVDTGATRTERALVIPERPYQVLAELAPPGFAQVRKFVVGKGGRVLRH